MAIEDRKQYIMDKLRATEQPISATSFGKMLSVSRQIIVNDIALLRAAGEKIVATPRGYLLESGNQVVYTIACKHSKHDMEQELMTIIECGCGVLDVIVNHDIYGQLSAKLCIYSRNDVDEFLEKIKNSHTLPLCSITNDYHFHTLHCPTPQHFERVKSVMREKGFCL